MRAWAGEPVNATGWPRLGRTGKTLSTATIRRREPFERGPEPACQWSAIAISSRPGPGRLRLTACEEDGMPEINVNGRTHSVDAEPDTPLLWVIREQLGMTGTKYGCGIAQCGSCTVHVDGAATRSCALPLSAVTPEQKIVTIEGLSPDSSHPLQKAWAELDVPQCGYCQSGMIMAAASLLQGKPNPTDEDINAEMTNICRCGTYNRVRAAIKLAAGDTRRG
jgi:isoquinoline 1-oxidoreductase alpha subunit